MFDLFRKQPAMPPGRLRESVEINISTGGQFSGSSGALLTDEQMNSIIAGHLADLQDMYYRQSKINAMSAAKAPMLYRLKLSVEAAEKDKTNKLYKRSFFNIAEAYECYAMGQDPATTDAPDGWDLAWNVLNRKGLEVVLATSKGQKESLQTDYSELLFARGLNCLRQMIYTNDAQAQNYCAAAATKLFYTYLFEIFTFGLDHWQKNDAIKNIHIAVVYGQVLPDQIKKMQSKIAAEAGNKDAVAQTFADIQKVVDDYTFKETNREVLQKMVY